MYPEVNAINALLTTKDLELAKAALEIDILRGNLDNFSPATYFGINYANLADVAWPTPEVVRIFEGGSQLSAPTIAALNWCKASNVTPILSLKSYPNPLPEVTCEALAQWGGFFTWEHESTNPAKAYNPATRKAAATITYERINRLAPGWIPGEVFMAWDINSNDASRHPDNWLAAGTQWVGFDTYDSHATTRKTFESLIERPAAYAQGLHVDLLVPETGCAPDRVGGAGYRDKWIVDMVRCADAKSVVAACWFSANVNVPATFQPEAWTLTRGGGLTTYRGVLA